MEVQTMVSQNVIPSRKHLGGYSPYVFTQDGDHDEKIVLIFDAIKKMLELPEPPQKPAIGFK
ncbi:MAG: hypothetical protein ACM3OC_09360 [Deltaproteobacteria bacterium]